MPALNFWGTLAIAVTTAAISGIITYLLQERKLRQEMESRMGGFKTEFMAEEAARHFLNHKKFTDRSFDMLKKSLGGWDRNEDELRRILVRAGAIRTFREDGSEWWTLIERMDEKVERWEEKRKKSGGK